MKLIDLLVQELPKRGGWPKLVSRIHQDHDGDVYGWTGLSSKLLFNINIIADDCRPYGLDESIENMVTHSQYESALSASQKPANEWSGEGLPPVGMHCKIVDPDGVLMYGQGESGEVIAHVENTAVIRMSYGLGCFEAIFLRPARSEADKKRDAAVEAIDYWLPEYIPDTPNEFYHAKKIYDAIAAGKIPGVKLED